MLLLLNFHDHKTLYNRNHPSPDRPIFDAHIGCVLHNEFLLYLMMMPYLLYCRSIHASAWSIYLPWSTALIGAGMSLALATIPDHSHYSVPYWIGLGIISLAVLMNKRNKRIRYCIFFDQFEELKTKYNELSIQLESMQHELVDQRHLLANAAHDLKTVSIQLLDVAMV